MPNPIVINWWAILVAAVSGFALGAIWYGPLFGKAWMRAVGLTEEEIKSSNPAKAYGITLVLSILFAYVMAHSFSHYEAWAEEPLTWLLGVQGAFWIWLGYVFTVRVSTGLFSMHKWSLIFIDSGYRLFQFLIAGAIIGGWR